MADHMPKPALNARDAARRRVEPPAAPLSGSGVGAEHPLTQLQRLAGNRAVQRFVARSRPPATMPPAIVGCLAERSAALSSLAAPPSVQRFSTDEHLRLGDQGANRAHAEMVTLAPGYQLTYGEMIAMAGDFFDSLDQMRRLASVEGTGAGTREEVEYVRTVKVRHGSDKPFSDGAKAAAERRYTDLAMTNRSHFVNPETGDASRSTADKTAGARSELRLKWDTIVPHFVDELVVPRAGAGYRHYHLQAMFNAYVAGFQGRGMEEALAAEAFGAHYLTDAFSGGHLRTARSSISDYWNPKVPMFTFNAKGFIAQALALRIGDAETFVSREMAYQGFLWKEGTLEKVSAVLDEKGAFTFGDVVSGAIHDYDSARGVVADVDGKRETLMGDNKLGGRTEEVAVEAVNLSHNDITRAWAVGKRRGGLEEALAGAVAGGLVGAERMLPKVVSDNELPPEQQSVKWDFPTADDLLDSGPFQKAAAEFGRSKADMLAEVEGSLPPVAKPHFAPAVVDPFRTDAVQTIRRIVHWTPDTGGGFLGHNQDDNAFDYYNEAKRNDVVATLTIQQRARLIRDLLDGYTAADEEDAVFDIVTANPAHSDAAIAAIGWDRLEDEIGVRFTRRYPETKHK